MVATKHLLAVHSVARMKRALAYIMNVNKTTIDDVDETQPDFDFKRSFDSDGVIQKQLVSGYLIDDVETASEEMLLTKQLALKKKGNSKSFFQSAEKDVLVHHLTQSFSPDDKLTPEEIHEIGRKTAIELLGGEHEFIIATHVDQKHINNHIIFNSTNQRTLKKFEWHAKKTYNAYRNISDKHAALAGAYIIKPETRRLKQYGSYHREINFKDEIKSRIDFLLRHSISLGDFENKAAALNLSVDWSGKHTTYKLLDHDQKKSTRARSLVRRSEAPKYNLEQIFDVTKRNDGVVLSTSEIKASYDKEQKSLQEEFQLRFTLEPWQVEAQTDEGVYVNLDYGRGKQGTVLIPARSLEQEGGRLEVFINKNDFFYFINPDNSKDNRYMTGATIAKQLTNENATPLIKKNSHISTIHRLVEQYNFLSCNGVTSGTQLEDLLDRFNNELDATESSLNQLDERLVRQKQVSKALLASQSGESFEQELAQKLLTSLNIPEHLTYEKSEILADQIEIETEALRDRYKNIGEQFDKIDDIILEYNYEKDTDNKNSFIN